MSLSSKNFFKSPLNSEPWSNLIIVGFSNIFLSYNLINAFFTAKSVFLFNCWASHLEVATSTTTKQYLYRAVEASAYKLGLSKIPLWQHHRTDPSISYEEQFDNVMTLKEHGYVAEIGLSNVNAQMLRHAIKAGGTPGQGGIVSVQNEYSPNYRHWPEVIDICNEFGIAYLPWSPLGGNRSFKKIASGEIGTFKQMAESKGVSPYALTIAWHLNQFPTSIPIPGASTASSILDSLKGVDIVLTEVEIAQLNASCPTDTPINGELLDIATLKD
jgi:aryl-alcohol dehydrogenase-like predicted oxidoreductase